MTSFVSQSEKFSAYSVLKFTDLPCLLPDTPICVNKIVITVKVKVQEINRPQWDSNSRPLTFVREESLSPARVGYVLSSALYFLLNPDVFT